MKTYKFKIQGIVQGVGYRLFCYLLATSNSIKGNVKNLDDGSVEVYVQGTEEKIRKYKKLLYKGNKYSTVTAIEEEILEMKEFTSFEIKY